MKESPHLNKTNLTQSQLMIWTGQELNPEVPLYNVIMTYSFLGSIDTDQFSRAFNNLVVSSDAMRTVFTIEDGVPIQKVSEEVNVSLQQVDFSTYPDKDQKLNQWIKENNGCKFDLTSCAYHSALIKMDNNHYLWYLNQHHLITDAWGVTVQYQLLKQFYHQQFDQPPALPKFNDYITYEAAQLADSSFKETKEYWEKKIAHAPPALKLYGYADQVLDTGSTRVSVELGVDRTNRLKAIAGESDFKSWTEHLSMYNLFATLLFAFLYRVSGQTKIAIGTPAHNRTKSSFKQTPGVFIQFFPLHAETSDEISFKALNQAIKQEVSEFMLHAVPGSNSVEANRSFQVVLNYIHAKLEDFNGIPMRSQWIHPGHSDSNHYLRLQIHDFDDTGSLKLDFDLNNQLFDGAMQQLVPDHFLNLMDSFMADRDQAISRPMLVSKDEFNHLISNSGECKQVPDAQTVIDLFQQQVASNGSQIAIQCQDERVSYEVLDKKSNQLANYLLQQGVTQESRIVLFMTRSVEFLVAIWGVLKTGASYVPLDASFPQERVESIIKDLEASVILTKSSSGLFSEQIQIDLDSDWSKITEHSETSPPVEIDPNDLAYIIYTSGTTGVPKGVMISHQALSNYINFARNEYLGGEALTFPLFTTPAFDLTVTSIFTPLTSGGKIIVYPETEGGVDTSILEVIDQNQVDIIKLTPSHLGLISKEKRTDTRIKKLILGGEDFKSALAQDIHFIFGSEVDVFNEYGPTEATVGCIVHKLQVSDLSMPSIPIGRPTNNMQAYLLDSNLQPVPRGVLGELYLTGAGLSKGYWNKPEITEDRFIDNPFGTGKMYKTGDLARWNHQNDMEYHGRKDRQIKVSGIRVEPGEIEGVISNHPDVKMVVVDYQQRVMAIDEGINCVKCGLPSNYPSTDFDKEGVCDLCRSFEGYQQKTQGYFKQESELKETIKRARTNHNGSHDCIMLLSGGKDSTYALARLVEMGLKVLAFTLDNGYISDQAKSNINRVVKALGVDHVFGKTPAMNAIFVDSLKRHCNVCNGCFKTIYTLSTNLAVERGIPTIVTGLSRGQFFETRLTEELFRNEDVDFSKIDQTILEARKAYHKTEDAVTQLLDVSLFENEEVFDRVKYVDFYRFCDVSLDRMYRYLDNRLPWVRPTDTGRSTNCTINQVGIYEHKRRMGYSNYAFPYSWDVRMGHKTREASLEEINEVIDEKEVFRIMEEIGYDSGEINPQEQQLVAYYISETQLSAQELRDYSGSKLPDYMIPKRFVRMTELPLTANGKVDYGKLPGITTARDENQAPYRAPETQVEQLLAGLWSEVLQLSKVGVDDDFIHLGGNSLAAIRLMARINEAFQLDVALNKIFEFPTISSFARFIEDTIDELLQQQASS